VAKSVSIARSRAVRQYRWRRAGRCHSGAAGPAAAAPPSRARV